MKKEFLKAMEVMARQFLGSRGKHLARQKEATSAGDTNEFSELRRGSKLVYSVNLLENKGMLLDKI